MRKESKEEPAEPKVKAEVVKREIKQESFQSPVKKACVESRLVAPSPKKVEQLHELSRALVAQGFSPPSKDFEQVSVFSQYGQLGGHHGIKGKEFGYLGGRPHKRMRDGVVVVEQGSGSLIKGNRRLQAAKQKNDTSFGIEARLQVCNSVELLLPIFQEKGLSLNDVFIYLKDETGIPKATVGL